MTRPPVPLSATVASGALFEKRRESHVALPPAQGSLDQFLAITVVGHAGHAPAFTMQHLGSCSQHTPQESATMALASLPVPTVVSTFTHLEHSLRVRSFDSGKAPVLVGRATTLTWVTRHFEHQFAGLSLAFAAVVL